MHNTHNRLSKIGLTFFILASFMSGLLVNLPLPAAAAREQGLDATPTATASGPNLESGTVDRQVAQSSDDAEEVLRNGVITLTSSDLEFVNDPDGQIDQLLGIRFTNITIPPGVTIRQAYILFTIDETSAITTALLIHGEASDSATAFEENLGNLSQRAITTATVAWNEIAAWSTIGGNVQTPDLSSLVQEIIDRPAWQTNNALAFVISGSGRRTAVAYDGSKASAPQLHLEWQRLSITPTPTIMVTSTMTATLAPATLTPTATLTVTATPSPMATATPLANRAPQCRRSGGVVREVWNNLEGSAVADLTTHARFHEPADQVEILSRVDVAPNLAENYGTRIRGYLCPLRAGEYTFWIASDDQGQLWLSRDQTLDQRLLIALVSSWTTYHEWDKASEQQSQAIQLQANQAYYFEVLHKESSNDDGLALAWAGPGLTQQIIEGRYVAPYADNLPELETKVYLPVVSR